MKNVGFILNETIKRHPTFFTNFHHVTNNKSILYFIEIIDEYTIRLKSNIQLNLLPEIINDLKSNFTVID